MIKLLIMLLILFAVFGLIVAFVFWDRRWQRYRARSLAQKLQKIMETVEIEQIPQLSKTFADFVREVHGIDLSMMDFWEHVLYISRNLQSLWRPGAARYFPEGLATYGKLYLAVPAAADLGELVRAHHPAEWIRSEGSPESLPFLRVDSGDGKFCYCHAFNAVWLQMPFKSKYIQPIVKMFMPFKSPEALQQSLKEIEGKSVGEVLEKIKTR